MFKQEKEESISQGLRRLVKQRVLQTGELIRANDPASHGKVVHATRTTIKELRGILRLVRPSISEDFYQPWNLTLRDTARDLAEFRDSDVARKTLGKLAQRAAKKSSSLQSRRFDLRDSTRRIDLLLNKVEHSEVSHAEEVQGALEYAHATLSEFVDRFESVPIYRDGAGLLRRGLQKMFKQGKCRFEVASLAGKPPVSPDSEIFHEWRKRVKYLLYQIRAIDAVSGRAGKLVSHLNRLETELGNLNDLAVFASKLWAAGHRPSAIDEVVVRPAESAAVIEVAGKRREKLISKSLELGRAIYNVEPRYFARTWARGAGKTGGLKRG